MKIESKYSPNFDERTLPVSILVLHYTGMETGKAAIQRLCDPSAKVSAHYIVEEDGRILSLVDSQHRAWHAGVSSWRGITDVNSASIGIEIVNGGHDYGLPEFPDLQIDAVIKLSRDLIQKFDIQPGNIVGHSDIAPERKQDPGEKFPWQRLAEYDVGLWPQSISEDSRILFNAGERDRGVAIVQKGLSHIGYEVAVSGQYDPKTVSTVTAFQRRYRPQKIDGSVDVQTLELITWVADHAAK